MNLDFTKNFYSDVLLLRPPVPVTVNKAGANYKSETPHEVYYPQQAFEEWIQICEGIVHFGGDALFDFEQDDEAFLDHEELRVDADGTVWNGSHTRCVGTMHDVMTGRVFTANGPWVQVDGRTMRALFPNMLAHRVPERAYYATLLDALASACNLVGEYRLNPYRWEGLADVAVMRDRVLFTHTVAGHYDHGRASKTLRSSMAGLQEAASFAGIPADAAVFAELVYPHFHGDTVHFAARADDDVFLFHYGGGIWAPDQSKIPETNRIPIDRLDAVEHYAANSRQVGRGLLVPEGPSDRFLADVQRLGLEPYPIRLSELFGKAGGGPACATLYLPATIQAPRDFRYRYSLRRLEVQERLQRIPKRVLVDRRYFESAPRG